MTRNPDFAKGLISAAIGTAMGGYGILTSNHLIIMIGTLIIVLGSLLALLSFNGQP